MMKKWFVFVVIIVIFSLSFGGFTRQSAAQETRLPGRSELTEGWNELAPGGATTCARGTPYSFFVRPADSEKLMIFFEGGGACWDQQMCAEGSTLFNEKIQDSHIETRAVAGIFDLENTANPVADYNMVYVSYCTADVHTGSNTTTYEVEGGEPITIEHKGFVNATAVLEWVYANYQHPTEVLVTGCSAGAFGSIMAAPYIMQHYGDVPVTQIADSGTGVARADWRGFDNWGFDQNLLPEFANLAEISADQLIPQLYIQAAGLYPDNIFAQYATTKDRVLTGFYFLMRGVGYTAQMETNLQTIHEAAPNFRSFVAGGDSHCILPYPRFYTYFADGVMFRDWFAALVNHQPVENVHCQGDECNVSPAVEEE